MGDQSKSRTTYAYCESERRRLGEDLKIDHYTSQALTGHGNCRSKLKNFRLAENDLCEHCKVEETGKHVIYECAWFDTLRTSLRARLEELGRPFTENEV